MNKDKIFFKFKNLAIVKIDDMDYEYRKNIIGKNAFSNSHLKKEIFQLAVLSDDGQRARLISDIYNMKDAVYCKYDKFNMIFQCVPLKDCNIEPYVTQKRPFIKQKEFCAVCNSEIKDHNLKSSQSVLMELEDLPTNDTEFSLEILKSNNDRFVLSQIYELNRKMEEKIISPEF